MSLFSRIKSLFGSKEEPNNGQNAQSPKPQQSDAAAQTSKSQTSNAAEEAPQPKLNNSAQGQEEKQAQKELTPEDYFAMGYQAFHNKDIQHAMEYLTKGADMGENNAQTMLGIIYFQGVPGVLSNMAEAERRFRQAAEWGNPEAQYNLGVMHLKGLTQQVNMQEALMWIEKAASRNFPQAQQLILSMQAQGLIRKA